ncbi:hypothetical protein [Bacillus sp. JJ722]|uniref:hypothetical protein n=1 Tax=Bacillus sp. JJ722 TaxID=3122973 RepID=UPI002FFFAAA3
MKKRIVLVILFVGLVIVGCSNGELSGKSNGELSGKKPPKVFIELNDERFETVLGTYCWKSGNDGICVDKAGPKELLEGKKPVRVKAGEKVKLVMDFEPKPNEIHLTQISGEKETEVELTSQQFTVPNEKGLYYYSYGVWWMDEKEKNVSNGDAFYAFALEVY